MAEPVQIAKYRVIRLLNRGGMGELYLCHQPGVNRDVAVKVLRTDLDPDLLRERFEREIAIVGGLRHRNIVTIFEGDPAHHPPYLAMEYIPGETLAELMDRGERLPAARIVRIVDDICAALACAHSHGIIHRDIKPSNVMIDSDGTVKVLDFGIARIGPSELTLDGTMIGTFGYMAPEQIHGSGVDGRTDVFAVGALAYELFSGERAFAGTTFAEVAGKVLYAEPTPLETLCPELPGGLADIVHAAMRKRRDDRFRDMQHLRDALRQVSEINGLTHVAVARPGIGPARTDPAVEPGSRATWDQTTVAKIGKPRGRRRLVASLASLGVVLLAAALLHLTGLPDVVPISGKGGPPRQIDEGSRDVHLPPEGLSAGAPEGLEAEAPGQPDEAVKDRAAVATTSGSSAEKEPLPTGKAAPEASPSGVSATPESNAEADPPATPVSGGAASASPSLRTEITAAPPVGPADETDTSQPRAGRSGLAPPDVATAPPVEKPTASDPVNDTADIIHVLNRYAAAMTNKDLAVLQLIRRFDPASRMDVQQTFADVRSWNVSIGSLDVRVGSDGTATASGVLTYRNVNFKGRAVGMPPEPRRFRLEKTPGGWVITEVVIASR